MRKGTYGVAFITLCGFLLLAFNFEKPSLVEFDRRSSDFVSGNELLIFFHYFGEPIVAVIVAILLLIYVAVRKQDYRAVLFVVLTFAGGNGLNQLLKHVVQRSRPELVDQLASYSFPSGHTMAGLFTFFTVAYLLTREVSSQTKNCVIWFIALAFVVLIGVSRVAEGRHFATDVIGGWSISYTWFIACVWWYERRNRQFRRARHD